MKLFTTLFIFLSSISVSFSQVKKAPAYPLITHDPYFSIWSFNDQLNSEATRHWTGAEHPLYGTVTVDGKAFTFLGEAIAETIQLIPSGNEAEVNVRYMFEKPE